MTGKGSIYKLAVGYGAPCEVCNEGMSIAVVVRIQHATIKLCSTCGILVGEQARGIIVDSKGKIAKETESERDARSVREIHGLAAEVKRRTVT